MVDPKSRRAREPHGAEIVELAEVHGLLLELAPLRDLAWAPLGQRVESLADAIRGGDGVTRGQVDQLRRWAHRWASLHGDLRTFYARVAAHPAGEAALWAVLDGWRLRGAMRGQLEMLWRDLYGSAPGVDLFPPFPVTRSLS